MKKHTRILSLVLALVLVFSCVGTAFAADHKTAIQQLDPVSRPGNEQTTEDAKGFKSLEFLAQNTYQYADDEIVRAIVLLDSRPVAEVANRGTAQAAAYGEKLNHQQQMVYRAMKDIDFTPVYSFSALLNGFSCDVAYGDLETIAAIPGEGCPHRQYLCHPRNPAAGVSHHGQRRYSHR